MTNSEKTELLDKLSVCYNQISYLKTISEENGEAGLVLQLEKNKKILKVKIDELLHDLYTVWINNAAIINNKLTDSNNKINQCISEIEKNINLTQNIIKAAGYVDDIIKVVQ